MTASKKGQRSGPLACVLKSPHPIGAPNEGYFDLMFLPPSCHIWFNDNGLPPSCLCHSIPDKMTGLLIDKRKKAIWRASVDFTFDTKAFQLSHMSGCWKHLNLKLGFVYLNTDKSEGILYRPLKREGVALLAWAFKANALWFLWLEYPGVSITVPWEVTTPTTTVYNSIRCTVL